MLKISATATKPQAEEVKMRKKTKNESTTSDSAVGLSELLSCPFCGALPHLIERKSYKYRFGVGCSNPACIIFLPDDVKKINLENYAWVYRRLEDLVSDWNCRAT